MFFIIPKMMPDKYPKYVDNTLLWPEDNKILVL